jgi:hypothetical protein
VSINGFTADSVDPTNPDNTKYVMARSADGKSFEVKKKP